MADDLSCIARSSMHINSDVVAWHDSLKNIITDGNALKY